MNPFLIRKLIYPAYRALKRDNVLRYRDEMRRVQVFEPSEIREYQWRKLRPLLEHAATRVPYYRKVFRQLGAQPGDFKSLEDISALPVLRKGDIRANVEDLIAEDYPRRHLSYDETGGSTGQNLAFYIDRESSRARLGNNIRMNEWVGIDIGDRWAVLWGVRFRVTRRERMLRALKNWFTNYIVLSTYKMDVDSVRGYLERLRRFKPRVIIAYPSALAHISQVARQQGLEPYSPGVIIVSGETLFEWQRHMIEQAFGATVINHYGSCEFGAVARECSHRKGLHVASDRVLLETLPIANAVAGEDAGEIVMTDLDNYGMPFIRYAIEDYGHVEEGHCACGLNLPRLSSMVGRAYDVIRAPNGNYLGGTFWGHILKANVEKFQIVQEEIDRVSIAVVPDGEFGDDNKSYVLERVREACGDRMRVEFDIRPEIEPTRSGKHRYVISRLESAGGEEADRRKQGV